MFELNKEDKALDDIFHGEKKPMHPDTLHITLGGAEKPKTKPVAKKESKDAPKEEKPVTAQWEPVKPTPNYMEKLKTMVKDTGMFAVLSMILFWWQQSGRLEETTAWWALLVCVGLMFFSIGRTCSGAVK